MVALPWTFLLLPAFRYHPDPVRSGSVVASEVVCRCCGQNRGYIYTGPIYAEADDLDDKLCPWCIASGEAHRKFDATFVDSEAFADDIAQSAMEEIAERTPGYNTFQAEAWPECCDNAVEFIMPAGIAELRKYDYTLEGQLMGHIVHEMQLSGGAAAGLLNALNKDAGPTVYLFRCPRCQMHHFHIDRP